MADSNRTGQRLLSSIRKAKAGDDASPADAPSSADATTTSAGARPPATPARKTSTRKTTARKTPASPPPAKQAPTRAGASATKQPQQPSPKAQPAQPTTALGTSAAEGYHSRKRVWPD